PTKATMRTALMASGPAEPSIEIRELDPHERRTAVRVTVRPLGREKPVDERPNLFLRERIARLGGCMARERARDSFDDAVLSPLPRPFRDAVEHVLEQPS